MTGAGSGSLLLALLPWCLLPLPPLDLWPAARLCELQQLAALPDLCVCVVGDKKTPADFQLKGVTYLSPDMQVRG